MKNFKTFLNESIDSDCNNIKKEIIKTIFIDEKYNFDSDKIINFLIENATIKLFIDNNKIIYLFKKKNNIVYIETNNNDKLEHSQCEEHRIASILDVLKELISIYDIRKIKFQTSKKEINDPFTQVKINKKLRNNISNLIIDAGFNKYGDLTKKINFLTNVDKHGKTIQNKIAGIILLDYLYEIKNNINSKSGGFYMEDFVAGLLGGYNFNDNSAVDIVVHNKKYSRSRNYQVKFWNGSTADLNKQHKPKDENDNRTRFDVLISNMKSIGENRENYLLMILKDKNDLLFINIPLNDMNIEFFETKEPKEIHHKIYFDDIKNHNKNYNGFTNKFEINNDNFENRKITNLGKINLDDIDEQLKSINEKVQESLADLWQSIKKLEDDVQDMTTKEININDVEDLEASKQAKEVDRKIQNLWKNMYNIKE